MIVIDEAHYVNQSGRNFRPEFESAVRFLGSLLKLMPTCIPVVLMSATILRDDVTRYMDLLGKKNMSVLHDSLQRRTVNFSVVVSGRSGRSLRKSAREDLEENSES